MLVPIYIQGRIIERVLDSVFINFKIIWLTEISISKYPYTISIFP